MSSLTGRSKAIAVGCLVNNSIIVAYPQIAPDQTLCSTLRSRWDRIVERRQPCGLAVVYYWELCGAVAEVAEAAAVIGHVAFSMHCEWPDIEQSKQVSLRHLLCSRLFYPRQCENCHEAYRL